MARGQKTETLVEVPKEKPLNVLVAEPNLEIQFPQGGLLPEYREHDPATSVDTCLDHGYRGLTRLSSVSSEQI